MLLIGLFHVSGIFAARTPARRTLQFRECCGLPTVNRYHGTLTPPRIAPSRPKKSRDGSIIIPNFSIMAISRTTRLFSLSVDRSLPSGGHGGRRQVASRKEERSAALTIQLSRNREVALSIFTIQRTFFISFWGSLQKIFLLFSAHPFLPQRQS